MKFYSKNLIKHYVSGKLILMRERKKIISKNPGKDKEYALREQVREYMKMNRYKTESF